MHGYGILNFSIKYFSVKYIFSFLFLCSIMNIMASTQQITDPSNNIFQQVLTNASGVQDRILGPTYPYYNNIKSPADIGMSDKGSLSALGKDIDGLISYVEVLVSGKSKASATGNPLGNKFFLQTGGKCSSIDTSGNNIDQDRYIYINNVQNGNIPFISQGMGVNFSEFKGLIPGTMSNLNTLNPYSIMSAFLSGSKPKCQPITLETINIQNNKSTETHYVTTVDLQNMDPCNYLDGKNPITGISCRETFQTNNNTNILLHDDKLSQLYIALLATASIYIIYKCMERSKY